MLQPEAVKMLTSFGRILRSLYPDLHFSTTGDDVLEVLVENSDHAPLLLFQVDSGTLELRFGGNLYQKIATEYEWETLTELLVLFISLVYPIYATRMSIQEFLSTLFGLRIRNWSDLLGRLLFGLSVSSSKVGDTFFLDQFSLKVNSRYVELDGPISARREHESDLSVCKSVLYFFSLVLQTLDLEVCLWDEDSSIISGEEASPSSSSSSVSGPDIDIDVSDNEVSTETSSDNSESSDLESPEDDSLDLEEDQNA